MELSTGCVIRHRRTGVVRVVGNLFTEKTTGIKYAVLRYIAVDRSLDTWCVPLYISEFEQISEDWEVVYV